MKDSELKFAMELEYELAKEILPMLTKSLLTFQAKGIRHKVYGVALGMLMRRIGANALASFLGKNAKEENCQSFMKAISDDAIDHYRHISDAIEADKEKT